MAYDENKENAAIGAFFGRLTSLFDVPDNSMSRVRFEYERPRIVTWLRELMDASRSDTP
jgi:hypothetical protein